MNSRKPCLCSRLERRYQQALPSDSPREAHLNTNDCSRWADAPGTKRRLQQVSNTPTHQTPEGHTAEATGLLPLTMQSHPWHPGSRSLPAANPTRSPYGGVPYLFGAPPRIRRVPFVQRRAVKTPGARAASDTANSTAHPPHHKGEHARRTNAMPPRRVVTSLSPYPFASGHTRLNTPDPI